MEDALRALHQLSLPAPSPAQLLDLLDTQSDAAERVAQLIALASAAGDGADSDAADLLGADLLTQAVRAILANLTASLEAARVAHEKEKEQLQKPAPVKMLPRKAHVARYTAALKRAARAEEESGPLRPRLVFDGGPSYVSRASLRKLEPISAAEMKVVPKRYEGRVLFLRTVAPPVPYVGLLLEGEDAAGNIVPVAVSHATTQPQSMDSAAALFPVGTLLAIKEPYLSTNYAARAAPGKPLAGIRIDSPTDLKVIRDGDACPPGFESAAATSAPSASLPWLDDPVTLHADQCGAAVAALLAAGRPGAAWRLLHRVRTVEKSSTPEHLALEGRIRYHAEDWAGAAAAFEGAIARSEISAGSKDVQDDPQPLSDSGVLPPSMPLQTCLRQARTHAERATQEPSAAELRSLYFAAAAGARRLDVRTYVGPAALRDIEGAGRGLVATRDVQPGEVILLCRAVAPQYPSGPPVLRLNLENGLVSTSSQIAAQTGLIHALVDRPELQLPVLGLTAGPDLPYSAFVREPYPLTVPPLGKADASHAYERPSVDAAYVDGVLRFNAFGPSAAVDAASGTVFPRAMPHPLPAILNHACLPNVSTTFHGDVLLSRALVPLPKGVEIVHPYVRGEQPYAVRQAQLSKHAFQCACELCRLDAADGEGAQVRARLVAGELPAILARSASVLKMRVNATEGLDAKEREAHEDIVEALDGIIERMAATYQPSRGSLRPELFDVFRSCAAHRAVTEPSPSPQYELDALVCAGAEARQDWTAPHSGTDEPLVVLSRLPALHLDACIEAMLACSSRLEAGGQPARAIRWTATAVWAHDCIIGGGLEVLVDRFGERYGPALQIWQQRFGEP